MVYLRGPASVLFLLTPRRQAKRIEAMIKVKTRRRFMRNPYIISGIKKKLFLIGFCIILACIGAVGMNYHKEDALSEDSVDSYNFLLVHIKQLIAREGIPRVMARIEKAFQNETITVHQCHSLLHWLWHGCFVLHRCNLVLLLPLNSMLCMDSYHLGLLSQIVLDVRNSKSDVMQKELVEYCRRLHVVIPDPSCFHGAGHAFVQQYRDVHMALNACDQLGQQASFNLDNCYQGVFSEYRNQLAGIDGDTDAPIPGVTPALPPRDSALEMCLSISLVYQHACVAQFSGIIYNGDILDSLMYCDAYAEPVAKRCAHTIASAYASIKLPEVKQLSAPSSISDYSLATRRGYIDGTFEVYVMLRQFSFYKDGPVWCRSLPLSEDQEYCKAKFNAYL